MKFSFYDRECRALVIGSSGAIGSAIVNNLAKKIPSTNVVTICRKEDGLDFMNSDTIALEAEKQVGSFRLIVDATGALEIDGVGPEKSFTHLSEDKMLNQFKVNTIGPALIIKNFMKLLSRSGKVVFVTLSARVGSISDNRLGGWISYRASKTALNQIVKTASIEAFRKNPDSVFMSVHPGTVKVSLPKITLVTINLWNQRRQLIIFFD